MRQCCYRLRYDAAELEGDEAKVRGMVEGEGVVYIYILTSRHRGFEEQVGGISDGGIGVGSRSRGLIGQSGLGAWGQVRDTGISGEIPVFLTKDHTLNHVGVGDGVRVGLCRPTSLLYPSAMPTLSVCACA